MTNIITMGKYRGKSIEHVSRDIDYTKWLISQIWFKERYIDMYNELLELDKNRKAIIRDLDDIVVYTDGACINNGIKGKEKLGGCGVYFNERNKVEMNNISERLQDVNKMFNIEDDVYTNNKSELLAICLALRVCKEKKKRVIIYTDSEYSLKAIYEWYPLWVEKGIKEKKKNYKILDILHEYLEVMDVKMCHVRAHTGLKDINSLGNAEADKLANLGANK
jgi:ribonuclease HI